MAGGISLQALIDQVKKDLLSNTGEPEYPVFFIEKVELEVAVSISAEGTAGIKIHVLDLGGKLSGEKTNTIKLTLTPILSREEQKRLLEEDPRMAAGVNRASEAILRKSGDMQLAGEPE